MKVSDDALGSLISSLPTAFFISSCETGEILFANSAAAAISGVPVEELVGRFAHEFYADTVERQRLVELLRRDGEVSEFETRMVGRANVPFWTSLSGRILSRPSGDVIVTAWRSIEIRKAAQDRVTALLAEVERQNAELERRVAERTRELADANDESARARQQLLEAVEAMSEGFVLWDADDRFVFCNSKYRTQFSSSPELLVAGMPFETVLRHDISLGNLPADQDTDEWVRKRMAQRRNPAEPFVIKLRNGQCVRMIEQRTREGGIVAIRTDVTELLEREQALAENRRLMRAVIDAVPAIINVKDRHSRYVLMNRFQGDMYGVEPALAIGRRSADFVGERYGLASDELDRAVISSGKALPFSERDFVDAKGRPHVWLAAKLPLHDPVSNAVANVVTVALDISDLKATEQARTNLSRYFAPNLVELLAASNEPLGPPRSGPVAVLFADIVGFTRICAESPPDEVFALLRAFQERMAACVFACGGTLDKYIGDAVMATFGTPSSRPDDATRALRCARAMLSAVATFNHGEQAAGRQTVQVAIGLHYGSALIGNIGTEQRLEFTVIGDTVNLASRLEKLARPLNVSLVASNALVARVVTEAGCSTPDLFGLVDAGQQSIRGRDPIGIWTLQG